MHKTIKRSVRWGVGSEHRARDGAARRPLAVLVAVALLALPALVHVQRAAAFPDTWSPAASPVTARAGHTSTLLPNGNVLVTGGYNGAGYLASAELYNPVANTWSAATSMASDRNNHTATLLPNGKVLVAGGFGALAPAGSRATAELYDPVANTWSAAASMAVPRYGHTATLLPGGGMLVAGGYPVTGAIAELYNPVANTWSAAGSPTIARSFHTATLLPNGKVLVAGGSTSTAELYDPVANTWSAAGSLTTARSNHTATLLPNGKVLVAGGSTSTAELYDPVANTWSAAGSLTTARSGHTATLLPNGNVLAAGGGATSAADLYDPVANTWSVAASLASNRNQHTATLLPNGKVLVAGGQNGSISLASAEIYGSSPERDHKTDANGDGYSAADETTIANCGFVSCASITTFGTSETKTCKDPGANCGSPGPPADESVPARIAPPPANGYGCSVTLDIVPPLTTKNLAKSDIDLDGVVSILDLSKVSSWFGNVINPSPMDPRWEGDMDGDGVISILDLSAMASNFGRSVAGNCKIE